MKDYIKFPYVEGLDCVIDEFKNKVGCPTMFWCS